MNRILMTGAALLTLLNAGMPANAADKHARQPRSAPTTIVWVRRAGR
jgi:hypothetical protein